MNEKENKVPEEFLQEFSFLYSGIEVPEPLLLFPGEREQLYRLMQFEKVIRCEMRQTMTIILAGRQGSGRKLLLMHVAYAYKSPVLFIDTQLFIKRYQEYGRELLQLILWKTEQSGCWLCFCDMENVSEEMGDDWYEIQKYLTDRLRSCFITAGDEYGFRHPGSTWQTVVALDNPDVEDRRKIWENYLTGIPVEPSINAQILASKYVVNRGEIKRIIRNALLRQAGDGGQILTSNHIAYAVKLGNVGKLEPYAKKVSCLFTWEDFSGDKELLQSLHNLCAQVKYRETVGDEWGFFKTRHYGTGICTLFYGPPGTGKTMAAQVVANELGMELYRVDVSKMSSKYIGETQKNISFLFEQAKEMHAILFFDEADAFFSRRAEVKDANDRHANEEIGHLLQKLEDYEGITILATNQKNNMDEAFKRRIRQMIPFRLPDINIRNELWKKAFPAQAPLKQGVEFSLFAERFELSGSEIKETAVNAAFLAAADESEITEGHIQSALKTCLAKYGRILTDVDFALR